MSYNIRLRPQILFKAWDQLYSSVSRLKLREKIIDAFRLDASVITHPDVAQFVSLERVSAIWFFYIVKVVSRWPGRVGIQILYIVWAILYPDHAMQIDPYLFAGRKQYVGW